MEREKNPLRRLSEKYSDKIIETNLKMLSMEGATLIGATAGGHYALQSLSEGNIGGAVAGGGGIVVNGLIGGVSEYYRRKWTSEYREQQNKTNKLNERLKNVEKQMTDLQKPEE